MVQYLDKALYLYSTLATLDGIVQYQGQILTLDQESNYLLFIHSFSETAGTIFLCLGLIERKNPTRRMAHWLRNLTVQFFFKVKGPVFFVVPIAVGLWVLFLTLDPS